MATKKNQIRVELINLSRKTGGLLKPEDVVAAARDKKSVLHDQFEWNNTEAAKKYRIQQARQMLMTVAIMLPQKTEPIRAFYSLPADRVNGGGYRETLTIMSDEASRAELLRSALRDLELFRRKYAELEELAAIFEAADGMTG